MSTLTPAALALGAGFVVGAAGAGWRSFRLRDDGLLPLTVALLFLGILSTIGPPFTHIINQGKVIAEPLAVLQWLVSGGYFLIGVMSVTSWLRSRDRPQLYLAMSLASLGVLSLLGQVWMRYTTGVQPPVLSLVLLLGSGFCFFLFRSAVIPARPMTVRIVGAVVVISAIVGLVIPFPNSRTTAQISYSAAQTLDLFVIIGVWAFCVGEPCVRLWLSSRGLPAVQRMRARFLAAGYGGLVALLAIAVPLVLAFQELAQSQVFAYLLEAIVIGSQPLIYFSLFPPAWLRRIWRESEEERFRLETHELLLGAPDARTLATRCLEWAMRLVGADAGCLVGLDGEMLAAIGLSDEQAMILSEAAPHATGRSTLRLDDGATPSNVVVVPLQSTFGRGAICVVAGRFTPLLGTDEVNRLTEYAASVTAAFDRILLLEQLSQARAQAEQASKRKSDHLSRMSHELRTPMSAILGFAELLSLSEPREDQKGDIASILKAAEHLLALINEVLEIALIESGGGSFSLEPVNLTSVVDEAIDMVNRRARMEQITLTKELHADSMYVVADMQRLRQALVNLLSNAVKYNRAHGSVRLRTSAANGQVRIEVIDTGQGIAPASLDRLFEPFDRIGREGTGIEGTGLGLALTKGLVEAMRGTIGVESREGEGSTFWVELERGDPPSVELEPIAARTVSLARAAFTDILYVEDNLANVEIVDRVLTQERPTLRLVAISKGAEALEYLEHHHPGLILLDLHLGDINGDEILQRVRNNPRLQDLPVVIFSADAGSAQIERLMSLGASDYMTKPVRVKTLLRVIDEGLAGTLQSSRLVEEPANPA